MSLRVSNLSSWSLTDEIESEPLLPELFLRLDTTHPTLPSHTHSLTGNVLPSQGHRAAGPAGALKISMLTPHFPEHLQ